MKKTFYFVRHGETDYNKRRIIQGSGVDAELNEKGRAQAGSFFGYYKNHDFDYIICSGLKRTYQTIQPFIEEMYIPYERTALINEISWGVHEGKEGNLVLKQSYERMIAQWSKGNFDASLEGAESARQLASRLERFLNYATSLPHQKMLICTHGRSLRCLLCLMKEQHLREMENYHHANTGLWVAEYAAGKFNVHKENDITHLDKVGSAHNW